MPAQIKIVQASFSITTPGIAASGKQLFAEAGWQGISLYCADTATQQFTDCVVYHYPTGISDGEAALLLKDIFAAEPLLQQQYRKTDIIYAFPECILTPHEVYNSIDNTRMLNTIFGDAAKCVVKTDFLYRRNLHAIYRTPVAINAAITARFSGANHAHLYSLLPDALARGGQAIDLICAPDNLLVLLQQDGALKIIQQFNTKIPEDAAYHLLSICQAFHCSPQEAEVRIHGMIDQDSALYAEFYKYFLHLAPATPPATFTCAPGFSAYPAHFFSHLFTIAACV